MGPGSPVGFARQLPCPNELRKAQGLSTAPLTGWPSASVTCIENVSVCCVTDSMRGGVSAEDESAVEDESHPAVVKIEISKTRLMIV